SWTGAAADALAGVRRADRLARELSGLAWSKPATPMSASEPRLSRASAGRLSLYLRRLDGYLREGRPKVSSVQLGDSVGVTDAQVRKDLAYLGHLGHPGVGYPIRELSQAIRRTLGLDREWG